MKYNSADLKILVLGEGMSGKGTFTKMLAKRFNFKYTSSSEFAFPIIKPALLETFVGYLNDDDLYESRRSYRDLWKQLIKLINIGDKTTLTRMILKDHNIYDGMRDWEEYEASKFLFDYIFYVDASMRNTNHYDSSMQIPFDPSIMIMVPNNLTEYHLQKVVDDIKFYNPEGELLI